MTKKILEKLSLAPESKVVIGLALISGIISYLILPKFSIFFVGILLFLLLFFREPKREIPDNIYSVVSPASGRIAYIDIISNPNFSAQPIKRIGIFLSYLDVHIQRIPFSGRVEEVIYKKGSHFSTLSKSSFQNNESNAVVMSTEIGRIAIKQIAGKTTRRIICNICPQKEVRKGDRLGMILFGSMVELYIPVDLKLEVKLGDRVIDGETVMALVG